MKSFARSVKSLWRSMSPAAIKSRRRASSPEIRSETPPKSAGGSGRSSEPRSISPSVNESRSSRARVPPLKLSIDENGHVAQSQIADLDVEEALKIFYIRYNPEKLKLIKTILEQYKDEEAIMFNELIDIYNVSIQDIHLIFGQCMKGVGRDTSVRKPYGTYSSPSRSTDAYDINVARANSSDTPILDRMRQKSREFDKSKSYSYTSSCEDVGNDMAPVDEAKYEVSYFTVSEARSDDASQFQKGFERPPSIRKHDAKSNRNSEDKKRQQSQQVVRGDENRAHSVEPFCSRTSTAVSMSSLSVAPASQTESVGSAVFSKPRHQKVRQPSIHHFRRPSDEPAAVDLRPHNQLQSELDKTRKELQYTQAEKDRAVELLQIAAVAPNAVTGVLTDYLDTYEEAELKPIQPGLEAAINRLGDEIQKLRMEAVDSPRLRAYKNDLQKRAQTTTSPFLRAAMTREDTISTLVNVTPKSRKIIDSNFINPSPRRVETRSHSSYSRRQSKSETLKAAGFASPARVMQKTLSPTIVTQNPSAGPHRNIHNGEGTEYREKYRRNSSKGMRSHSPSVINSPSFSRATGSEAGGNMPGSVHVDTASSSRSPSQRAGGSSRARGGKTLAADDTLNNVTDWIQCFDDSRRQFYYHSPSLRKSIWARPAYVAKVMRSPTGTGSRAMRFADSIEKPRGSKGGMASPYDTSSHSYASSPMRGRKTAIPVPRDAHLSLLFGECDDGFDRDSAKVRGKKGDYGGNSISNNVLGRRQSLTEDNGKDHFSSPSGIHVKHRIVEQKIRVNTDHDSVSTISTTSTKLPHSRTNVKLNSTSAVKNMNLVRKIRDDGIGEPYEFPEVTAGTLHEQEREQEDAWEIAYDPRRQRVYWYHKKTRESTWTNPHKNTRTYAHVK